MKKALKEIIENAELKREGKFDAFMAIPNGVYNGFWGKNGYDNILFLGQSAEDGKWYKIAEYIDVVTFCGAWQLSIDIKSENGVPHFWSRIPFEVSYDGVVSNLIIERDSKGEER